MEDEVRIHRTFWKQKKRELRKIEKLRQRVRKAWIKANPPNHEGYWPCGLCGIWVHHSQMELDHILPSSKFKHLIAEFSNLQPTHSACNRRKGSKH